MQKFKDWKTQLPGPTRTAILVPLGSLFHECINPTSPLDGTLVCLSGGPQRAKAWKMILIHVQTSPLTLWWERNKLENDFKREYYVFSGMLSWLSFLGSQRPA